MDRGNRDDRGNDRDRAIDRNRNRDDRNDPRDRGSERRSDRDRDTRRRDERRETKKPLRIKKVIFPQWLKFTKMSHFGEKNSRQNGTSVLNVNTVLRLFFMILTILPK